MRYEMAGALFLAVAVVAASAANANVPDGAAIWQLPSGEIVFRDYPQRARAAGEQGVVGFEVRVNGAGVPISCEVTASSGFRRLDKETCDLLMLNAFFQPVGDDPLKAVHRGRVRWSLAPNHEQRTPVAAVATQGRKPSLQRTSEAMAPVQPVPRAPAATSKTEGNKLICKRVPRTDSIVGGERICKSARSWQKQ